LGDRWGLIANSPNRKNDDVSVTVTAVRAVGGTEWTGLLRKSVEVSATLNAFNFGPSLVFRATVVRRT
jgi:hypothetical protein